MEMKTVSNSKRAAIRIGLIAIISLLLLIPLAMVKGVIEGREMARNTVIEEVANSYAKSQTIVAPYVKSYFTDKKKDGDTTSKDKSTIFVDTHNTFSSILNYKADVTTDVLHRSIYDVIVYNSKVHISGQLPITETIMGASSNMFRLSVTDVKGFGNPSQLNFGGRYYTLDKFADCYAAKVGLPEDAEVGDMVDFEITFDLKGTESLFFRPSIDGQTTLAIRSSYPHPSFQGTLLPHEREVCVDGFEATWSVSSFNSSGYDDMGVKFVNPANPYQQSMRSAKYGLLIIVLVFVAGLFVEFLTHKEISPIQYAVIGLSLVLFYSLLLAFSEFIIFGLAYIIAASMTTGALIFYFRAILRSCSAYLLGVFVAFVYFVNYMLLQMETYALLAGSLVLFIMLCVIMYLTADINNKNKLFKNE